MRLVSVQVKKEIEHNLSFSIRVDYQIFRSCQRLMNLRVDTCTILSLQKRSNHGRKLTLFQYPERLKKFIFDGAINPSSLNQILGSCIRVQELTFTNEALRYSKPFRMCRKLRTNLENLSLLTHLSLQFTRHPRGDPFYTDCNIAFFLDSTFQNLRSFRLCYSLWGNWIDLFLFLIRHVDSLRNLELQCGDRNDATHTSSYLAKAGRNLTELVNMNILKKLRLVEFRFRDDVLVLNPEVREIIFDILSQQTSLEIFHFHSPGDMTVRVFAGIAKANQETLQEVVLCNLRTTVVPVHNGAVIPFRTTTIDMGIFSKCVKLRSLELSCAPTPANNPNQLETLPLQMMDLKSLPISLERLNFTGFRFFSEDIVTLSQKATNLRELLVMESGRMRYSTILTNVLKNCPQLQCLVVSPLTTRGSSVECWWYEHRELNKLYQRFMKTGYDPLEDLDGFEARDINDADREWIKENMDTDPPLA